MPLTEHTGKAEQKSFVRTSVSRDGTRIIQEEKTTTPIQRIENKGTSSNNSWVLVVGLVIGALLILIGFYSRGTDSVVNNITYLPDPAPGVPLNVPSNMVAPNPPNYSSSSSNQTQGSSDVNGGNVMSTVMLMDCYKRVSKYKIVNFPKPEGYSHDILLAAMVARESRNNPNAIGDNGKALGLTQNHADRVIDLNNYYGKNFAHSDYLGEKGVQKSLWAPGAYASIYLPKDFDMGKDLHMWINMMKGPVPNRYPTAYSEDIVRYMNMLRDELDGPKSSPNSLVDRFHSNPVKGARWKEGFHHDGKKWAVDMMADVGTQVRASADGIVTKRGYEIDGDDGGNRLHIEDDYCTRFYAHLDRVYVDNGDHVKKGQLIGTVGYTGNASKDSPHLHYEIRKIKANCPFSEPPWLKWYNNK